MLPILKPVWQLISVDNCRVDSNISRLHYLVTSVVLVAFSILLTSKVVVSDSILCHSQYKSDNDLSPSTLNTICYAGASDTYSKETTPRESFSEDARVPMVYQYQAMVFFLMALTFYAPKLMWNAMEGGITEKVVQKLSEPIQECSNLLLHYDRLRVKGLWLRYATLQNLIPSFPWIA